ncbi:STX6 [Bugula neritina]|uniref:STX6 n=1 Tax=Bugula neritina TaxID=10212 RepID=A0A7J7J627_BUGNE|nr:STX6 [Bugula neritina]
MAKGDKGATLDVNDSLLKVEQSLQAYKTQLRANGGDPRLPDLARDIKNSIRSIEWDLEDLQETVSIVEKTPRKFNLTSEEVRERQNFIRTVKHKLATLKDESQFNGAEASKKKNTEKQSLLSTSVHSGGAASQYNTSGKTSAAAAANSQFIEETQQQQQLMIRAQDEQIDNIGASVKVLKNLSTHIGTELEEQHGLLDEFGHEMENTGSKMDNTMKKIAKVTKMSTDKRQWCAIGVLLVLVVILIILISVL